MKINVTLRPKTDGWFQLEPVIRDANSAVPLPTTAPPVKKRNVRLKIYFESAQNLTITYIK